MRTSIVSAQRWDTSGVDGTTEVGSGKQSGNVVEAYVEATVVGSGSFDYLRPAQFHDRMGLSVSLASEDLASHWPTVRALIALSI